MNLLPNEIILEIFFYILKITDKRQFLKTCVLYNNITKRSMDNFEFNYNNLPHFEYQDPYSMENFTLELCHDSYFNLIPEHYIDKSNYNLIPCLSYYNCLPLLESAHEKGCDIDDVIMYAAYGGHIDIIKWSIKMGQGDGMLLYYTVEGGHFHLLKWLHEIDYDFNLLCDHAIEYEQIEMLKYAVELYRDPGYLTSKKVSNIKNDEIKEIIYEQGWYIYK